MNMSVASAVVAAVFTVALASCDTPNRTGYMLAAEQHARIARVAREGVEADEAAERSFAAQGNEEEARRAAESASKFRRAYEPEQFQANKDLWLSQWWPSFK
jgi:hypothetical protein